MSEINPKSEQLVRGMLTQGIAKFGQRRRLKDRESIAYIDAREMISIPGLFNEAVDAYRRTLDAHLDMVLKPDGSARYLAGMPETGLYYAGGLAYQIGGRVPLLQRRVAPKKHGIPKVIEGRYERGDEVVLVDDVITGAESKLEEAARYAQEGLSVTGAVVLVDRQQGGRTELKSHGIDFAAAMTLSAIVNYALAEKLGGMTQTMHDEVMAELDPAELNGTE